MAAKKLKVGVHNFKPLVFSKREAWTGFEIDLWKKVARGLGLGYEIQGEEGFENLLSKTAEGKYDIAMAGITRTPERAKNLRMSFLTLDTGLGIATLPMQGVSLKELFKKIFTKQTFVLLGILLLAALVNAHIFWFIERGAAVPSDYLLGVFDSFYYSVVTFSTVGYGDITPTLILGKVLTLFSLLVGLAIFGLYVGELSVALALAKVKTSVSSPKELAGKKVGVKKGTTSVKAVQSKKGLPVEFNSVEDAIQGLASGGVEAVVADLPVLQNLLRDQGGFVLAGGTFARQDYSFVFPKLKDNKKLIESIDLELIRVRKTGDYDRLYSKYFEHN